MADFTIKIIEDITPVVYTPHAGISAEENCAPDSEQRYNVKMLSTDPSVYSILSTYSGETWKYLTISNLSLDSYGTIDLYYNGTKLTNAELPLTIDIEVVSPINDVPLLEVVVDNYELIDAVSTKRVNASFTIEDIEGTKGPSALSSFQLKLTECPTPVIETPVIYSALAHTMYVMDPPSQPTQYLFEYNILSQYPVTSYNFIPISYKGVEFNTETGYIRIDTELYRRRVGEVIVTFQIQAINSGAIPTTDTETFILTIPGYDIEGEFDRF